MQMLNSIRILFYGTNPASIKAKNVRTCMFSCTNLRKWTMDHFLNTRGENWGFGAYYTGKIVLKCHGKKMLTYLVWTQKTNDSQTASCLGKWNIMATTSGIHFWINYNNRHLNLWKTHARVRLMTIFHSCGSRQMADLSNDGTIYGVLGETWVGFNPVVTIT